MTNSQPNETQFLDSHGNAVVIRHHVFEAGKQVKMQNKIHGIVESGQKGTWEMFTYDLKSEQAVETVKILDVDLQHNTSKSFEWDVVFTKKGIFSFVSRITYTDPNISAAFDSDIAIVDRLSKTYAENNGCPDKLKVIMKPTFSTVVCVTEDTQDELADRGWHEARGF